MKIFTSFKTQKITGKFFFFFFVFLNFLGNETQAQSISIYESYAIINANGAGNAFYDLNAVTANPDFQGANLGTFTASQTLILAGGQNKTSKCSGGNVTGSNIYYRVYPVSGSAGSFSSAIAYSFVSNDGSTGGCGAGNQTWAITNNTTNVKAGLSPGTYYLEVYADAPGTPGTTFANNGGANYKATFTVSSALSVYDFTGATTGAATTNATGGTLSVMTSNNNLSSGAPYVNSTSASSGYTGATGTNNIGNVTPTGALNTATSGYFEFTITPPTGGSVILNSMTFGSRGTGTGPSNYAIRTSADSYAANVGTGTLATSSTWTLMSPTISTVTGAAGAALVVRIYGYGGSGSVSAINWRIDDINITSGLSFTPSLTTTSSSLTFSTTQAIGTPTTSQTFNLSGANLTGFPGSITVSAPNTDFQVSNNNSTWGATTTIAYTTATLANTAVYVRFNPQSSGAKSGNVTFSGGGVSTPPTVAVTGTAVLGIPVATAATNIAATSFDANWGAVTGASSGYLLDVSTSATFGTTGSGNITENFTGYTGTTTFNSWTFDSTISNYTSAASSGPSGANSVKFLNSGSSGIALSPVLSGSATQLAFYLINNTAVGSFLIEGFNGTSWVTIQTLTSFVNSPGQLYTYNSGTTPALPSNITQFRFTYTKTSGNLAFDDVSINYTTLTPSFVSGYNAKPISGQTTATSSVTGLTADTTYYYRLRATDGTPSSYSNVITVNPASRGGSVASDQTICSGTQPTTLTLSGNNGTIVKWQKSTDAAFTSPTDITNTTSTLTGTAIGNLTVTTYFRAVIQSFTNPTANSAYATITVIQSPTYGNLQSPASGSICQSGTFDAYGQVYQSGVTEAAGAGAGISAQFGYNTTNTDPSTWTNWNDATFNTQAGNNDEYKYTFTPPSTGTYYYTFRYRQGTCTWLYGGYNNGFWNGTTNVNGSLVVSPTPVAGTASANQAICSGTTPIALTLNGSSGAIQWQSSTDNSTFNNISGQTSATLTLGSLSATTYYKAVVSSGGCSALVSNVVTITVIQSPTYGNLQSPASGTICQTGTFNAYGQVYQSGVTESAGAGAGITAQFGYNATNTDPSTWTNWSNATFNTQAGNNDEYTYSFTPPSSGTYYYTFRYRQGSCNWLYGGYNGGFWNGTSNVNGVLTVNSTSTAPTGITGTTTVCSGTGTTLTVTGGSKGTGAVTKWYTGSCGGTLVFTGDSFATGNLTSNTTYYVRYSGTCNDTTCATVTVSVNTLSTAPTGATGTTMVCTGSGTTLTVAGGSKGTGAVTKWYTGSCGGTLVFTGDSFTTGNLTSNTTYYVMYSGTCNDTTCATVTVSVNTLSTAPTGAAGTTTVCSGTGTTLTVAGGSKGTGAVTKWYTGSCGGTLVFTGDSFATGNLTSNTTYYVMYSGTCNDTTCATVTVSVNTLSTAPTGITGTTTVCSGTGTTLTVAGGSKGTGAVTKWYTGSCGGTLVFTGDSFTTGNLTSNTTYYVMYSGTCNDTTCATVPVNVTTLSTAPTGITGVTTICNGGSTTLTLSGGTAGTGAIAEWFTGSCGGTSAGTGNSITVSPSSNTTYYVRYNGSCNTTACASQLVTVNAVSTAASISGTAAICAGSSTNLQVAIAGGATPYSVVYTNGNTNFTVNPYTSGSNIPVSPTSTTTYTLVSVSSTGGCTGSGNTGSAVISVDSTTSTDGGLNWSNGNPSGTKSVIFNGSAGTITADLTACSLRLTNNAIVTVASGSNVTLNGAITVDSGSAFTLNNNANLLQNGTNYSNSGNIVVKRNTAALKRLDYNLWSSPVTGQELYAFSPLTFANRFYIYNAATDVYNAFSGFNISGLNADGVNGTDGNHAQFSAATGYLIRLPWNHPTAPAIWTGTFTGVPNNGNVGLSSLTSGLYYAIGNPYPSTISADQFISDNSIGNNPTTPGDGLYFWRKTNNSTASSYATYTTAGGVKSGGDTLNIVPNGVIQVGEGFIVKATSTALGFNNNQRIANNEDQFLKTASIERNRIWLNLSDTNSTVNQMMVAYMTGATQNVDAAIDGRFFNDSQTALNSLLDNEEFAIQGRSLPFNSSDIVPLAFKAATAGNYSIAIDHVDGLFEGGAQTIYLKDNMTNTYNDLNIGAYAFATAAGTFNDRFEIVYQNQLANPTFTANTVVVFSQNNGFVINSGNFTMSSVKVFDIRGRLIEEKNGINANQTTINGGLANEVLLVQITSEDGVTVTKKVIK